MNPCRDGMPSAADAWSPGRAGRGVGDVDPELGELLPNGVRGRPVAGSARLRAGSDQPFDLGDFVSAEVVAAAALFEVARGDLVQPESQQALAGGHAHAASGFGQLLISE